MRNKSWFAILEILFWDSDYIFVALLFTFVSIEHIIGQFAYL